MGTPKGVPSVDIPHHPDDGCDEAPKCLECPLDECKFVVRDNSRRREERFPMVMRSTDITGRSVPAATNTAPALDPPRLEPSSSPNLWRTMARQRLATVLAEIEAVDTKRREAESIQAALTAAGENLPQLPWARVAKSRRITAANQPHRTCSLCGHQGFPTSFSRSENGDLVCRSQVRCKERRGDES